jgi:hypothetical protein
MDCASLCACLTLVCIALVSYSSNSSSRTWHAFSYSSSGSGASLCARMDQPRRAHHCELACVGLLLLELLLECHDLVRLRGRAGGRADREIVRRTAQRGSTCAGGGGGAHRPLLLLDLLGLRLLHLGDCEARGRRGRGCERARAAGSRRRSGRNGMEPRYRSVWPSAAHGAGERQVSGRERRVTTAANPCAPRTCVRSRRAGPRPPARAASARRGGASSAWRAAGGVGVGPAGGGRVGGVLAGWDGWLYDGCCVLRRRYRYRCGTRICFRSRVCPYSGIRM